MAGAGDQDRLTAQVKLLLKTEQQLLRSQRQLDAEVQRLQGLSGFALRASRSYSVVEIVGATIDHLWQDCGVQAALALVRPGFEGPEQALLRAADRPLEPLPAAGLAGAPWHAWVDAVLVLGPSDDAGACQAGLALLDAAAPPDDWERRAGWRTRLIVPLGRGPGGDGVGALLFCRCAATRPPATAPSGERSFLDLLGGHASAAIEISSLHARQEERVRERTRELAEANERLRLGMESLRDAQARLVRASRMAAVGELAARVAHEINNPLAVLKADASWMARGQWHGDDQERAEVLEEVVGAIARIAASVGRLRAEAAEAMQDAGQVEPEE